MIQRHRFKSGGSSIALICIALSLSCGEATDEPSQARYQVDSLLKVKQALEHEMMQKNELVKELDNIKRHLDRRKRMVDYVQGNRNIMFTDTTIDQELTFIVNAIESYNSEIDSLEAVYEEIETRVSETAHKK